MDLADYRGVEETIYITKNMVLFMAYWGGALTCYAEHHGNQSSEGRGIKLMSRSQVLDWLEEREIEITEDIASKLQIQEA